jgi:membrane fusion protein (multidrug efflux system)
LKYIRILLIFLMVVIIGMIMGCSGEGVPVDMETSVPVRVKEVEFKSMKEFVSATGTVYAVKEALLKVEQAGDYRLNTNPRTGAPFAMGDNVLAGEVVVVINNPEFVNQVAIESKKLNYDISKREYEKQQRIYKKGGITLRELSDAERSYIDAGYAYDNAKLSLTKLSITVPFSGIIVDLPYFSLKQRVEANTMVVKVMDFSRLYTDVTLPGKEMSRVFRRQDVVVTNYNSPETLAGKVTQVSPSLDPENRMFKLRIEIENKDLLLKPGMFTKVDIVVKKKDSTMVIPREIILDRRGAKTVFIVQRGIALERRLEIGMTNRDEVEVLKGLEKEDRLVVQGFETLRHRSKVKVLK